MTLNELRIDFEKSTNKSVSMPIAGAIVWTIVAILSTYYKESISVYILLFASGLIFPIALLIAKFRRENLISSSNPLAKLMGLCVLMVNLLWGIHIPLVMYAPQFVPLSLGIGLGIHWIVYSWIIQHPLGIIHSILRTFLVVLAWFIIPESRICGIGVAIVIVYLLSIYQMLNRKIIYK